MVGNVYMAPQSYAVIEGDEEYGSIRGFVYFFEVNEGSLVWAEVTGIPDALEDGGGGFLGFHVHEGSVCAGDEKDPFADTGGHFNPAGRKHPRHDGDLPPLLASNGTAWMGVYTGRFTPMEVVGRTVVLHQRPDDLHTQPAGDSGGKVACGEIVRWASRSEGPLGFGLPFGSKKF